MIPVAIIVSESRVKVGQDHRASGNFSTKWYGHTEKMKVVISQDNSDFRQIEFDIKEDKSGEDTVIARGLKNDVVIDYYPSNQLYIAFPDKNKDYAGGNVFTVTFQPVS